jgi:hypothetical protein
MKIGVRFVEGSGSQYGTTVQNESSRNTIAIFNRNVLYSLLACVISLVVSG